MVLNELQKQQLKLLALSQQNGAQAAEIRDLKQQQKQIAARAEQLDNLQQRMVEMHAALLKLQTTDGLVASAEGFVQGGGQAPEIVVQGLAVSCHGLPLADRSLSSNRVNWGHTDRLFKPAESTSAALRLGASRGCRLHGRLVA